MDREQHLEWSKQRAKELISSSDLQGAFTSFLSDMGKHPETASHPALYTGLSLLMGGHLVTTVQMNTWIDGFN